MRAARYGVVATLIHLRHDLSPAVLGVLFGVDRSTVSRAAGEVGRLLDDRCFVVSDRTDLRHRTLEDVLAYAPAKGVDLRLGATEAQARRPVAGRRGKRAFVSARKKQNAMKGTVIPTAEGAPCGTTRCGRDGCTTPPPLARRVLAGCTTDLECVMSSWWGGGESGAGEAAVDHVAA
ncbi:transposase family protein, partial [Streptomyces sp. NPDC059788]|uniref:transposase family protein n=1 Tax=Streptomyces sp. NPDC059788 TaxID=3346948 RepID=UPI0036492583